MRIKQGDTLESLSAEYYGRPDYYWVIADFNRMPDPFVELFGSKETLLIPSLATISFRKN